MKYLQLALASLCLMVVSLATASEINGAFGIEFGVEIDVTQYKQVAADKPYGLEYAFIPVNPYGPLSSYSVFVTPQTHRAYQVRASGSFTSMAACRRVLVDLEESLEKKYDKTSKKLKKDFGASPKISFGRFSRTIEGGCTGFLFNKRLNLIYTDKPLRELAGQEYLQLQQPAHQQGRQPGALHDTSGL